jgi:hypothetical protein
MCSICQEPQQTPIVTVGSINLPEIAERYKLRRRTMLKLSRRRGPLRDLRRTYIEKKKQIKFIKMKIQDTRKKLQKYKLWKELKNAETRLTRFQRESLRLERAWNVSAIRQTNEYLSLPTLSRISSRR